MKPTRHLVVALTLFIQAACATTATNVSPMQVRNELDDMSIEFDDLSIEQILSKRPQLTIPFRLAVAPPIRREPRYPVYRDTPKVELWSSEEIARIEAWGERAKQAGLISELVLMPSALLRPGWEHDEDHNQLLRVRAAAARQQADAVLILNSVTGAEESYNALAILDLTLVASFFLPGHKLESFSAVEAMVIDVRNEFLYFSARGEASTGGLFALFDRHTYTAEQESKARLQALDNLGEKLMAKTAALAEV